MTSIRTRRVVATIATASCIAVPTTAAGSVGTLPPTYKKAGAPCRAAVAPAAFHAGDTPADYPGARPARSAAPADFHAGDTPAD
jgi:hypothetical protein